MSGDNMKDVINYLDNLLKEKDTVVLGCSGGPDSMALMHILLDFRKSKNISIICAHVNHKVRRESDDEMVWMEDFCKKHKVAFEKMITKKDKIRKIRQKCNKKLIYLKYKV